MNRFIRLLWWLGAGIRSIFAGGEERADLRLVVGMEFIGPDGKVWHRSTAPVTPARAVPELSTQAGRFARLFPADALLLILAVLVAFFLKHPEALTLGVARVTTAGLNKLLDATIKTGLTSPAWYVGLVKQVASDGAITSGAAVLTSASNPFALGDVGRAIIVQGAGAAGADLSTTILSFTNAGSVTLAANAGTTVTGARFAFECRLADTMGSHASFVESTSYSNANRPTYTPGTIASGSVDNASSVAQFTINATDYIFGAFLTDNNTKGGTTGTLFGAGVNSGGSVIPVVSGGTLNVTLTTSATAT